MAQINVVSRNKAKSWTVTPYSVSMLAHKGPDGVRGKWMAYAEAEVVEKDLTEGAVYHNGWNGSYHDAHYDRAYIAVFGRSPGRARKKLLRVLAIAKPVVTEDHSVTRFKLRNLVREGD